MSAVSLVRLGSSTRLDKVLQAALSGLQVELLAPGASLAGRNLVIAVGCDEFGHAPGFYELVDRLRREGPRAAEGSCAALLVDGAGELYTKELARTLALALNCAGCWLPGKPLVEATGSLYNFHVLARLWETDAFGAYVKAATALCNRLPEFSPVLSPCPSVLMLHASERATSNTLQLGDELAARLSPHCRVNEVCLINGEVHDCRGCTYTACRHFAETGGCFYGGSLVQDVFPQVLQSNALLVLCPNYNDAPGANISAFINRLTSLLVKHTLFDKALFAVVVSGYSGGDLVAKQLLGSLCLNKTFSLPPHFCLAETALDARTALDAPGVHRRLDAFAHNILEHIKE